MSKAYKTVSVLNEMITLANAQLHLRLDTVGGAHPDDSLVDTLIAAAREDAEKYTGLAIADQQAEIIFDEFSDDLLLDVWPVQSITSITYVDTAGATQTLSASEYVVDYYSKPVLIRPVTAWPQTKEITNAVKVSFYAGFTDYLSPNPYPMPKAIKQAMLLMIGHLYQNREAISVDGRQPYTLPLSYLHLLTPHRIKMGV